MRFNITLEVDGVVVAQEKVGWYHQLASGSQEEGATCIALSWVSGRLAAGVHTARVMWASQYDATGSNQIYFATPNRNVTRSITMQEIRANLF
ncbi:MAG: hypothetical protein Q6373_010045 [Candidatus Sigynarchaeota archaeon]